MTATLAPARPEPGAVDERPRRGRAEWIALAVLLAATAGLYLWNLGAEGWANTYYAGAVRAMTQNWTAFFFGSTDAGNTVTVDKPPASLWVMALSARVFGLSSWSMLVPQALMGVGSVALLYAAVRRVAGPAAALLGGAVFALTPIAVLMFRYNNPDALLVLLLVAAAYATVRAVEKASTRWIMIAGALIGFAFLAKMMQAFVVIPALALTYLVAAPTGYLRRIRQLLAAGLAVVVSAGWWVAIAELWPASSRPYIGGSENNSVLDLTFGYNGFGRIFGQGRGRLMEAPAGAQPPPGMEGAVIEGGGGFGGFGGAAGWTRLFGEQVGGQISWLLPAALVLLVVGLVLTRRTPRTDRMRASLLLWGGWTVVTAAVFSFARGSSTPTTRWRSPRASPRSSGSAGWSCGGAGPAGPPGSPSPWSRRGPRHGPWCSCRARPSSCRGCAGSWSPWPLRRCSCCSSGRTGAASPSPPRWPSCSPGAPRRSRTPPTRSRARTTAATRWRAPPPGPAPAAACASGPVQAPTEAAATAAEVRVP